MANVARLALVSCTLLRRFACMLVSGHIGLDHCPLYEISLVLSSLVPCLNIAAHSAQRVTVHLYC